jgi:hypothetical protein
MLTYLALKKKILELTAGFGGGGVAHEPDLRNWGATAARAHEPKTPSWQPGSFPANYCTVQYSTVLYSTVL